MRQDSTRWLLLLLAASPLVAIAIACVSSAGSGPFFDAGPDVVLDGGVDANADAAPGLDAMLDAGNDRGADAEPDAMRDAPSDALLEAGPPILLLTTVDLAGDALGASFAGGAWSSIHSIGSGVSAAGGGGVAVSPDRRGVVVLRSAANGALESTIWDGAWPALATLDSESDQVIGAPVPSPKGVSVAHQIGVLSYPIALDELNRATSKWTTDETTPSTGDNVTAPAIAITGSGDSLILASTGSAYTWSLRTSGVWSEPAVIAGLTPPSRITAIAPAIAAASLTEADSIVGVFANAGATPSSPTLQSATFVAGAWSTPISVASDLSLPEPFEPLALASLPDGRVALAYEATANTVNVGFWNGSAWSAFTAVPGVTTSTTSAGSPLSIARGTASAELELAYVDPSGALEHTRLTDEASWAWTPSIVIDASTSYAFVSIAVGP